MKECTNGLEALTKQLEYPMPASLGEMCFHTPMLPCRMHWPAASSMKKRGTPITTSRITYSTMNAPAENTQYRVVG